METSERGGGITLPGSDGNRRVVSPRLVWVAPLVGLLATALSAAVYLGASALGSMPQDVVVQGRGPVTLGAVIFSSFVPAPLAAGALALFGRFTRRPVKYFVALAAVALVLSFATPFSLVGAPASMRAILLLMHVLVATITTGGLIMLATREDEGGSRHG